MRILFMTQVLPFPLDAGPKIRAHHVIRSLVDAGHDVRLLSFIRPGEPTAHVEALKRLCASVETVPMLRSRMADLRHGVRSLLTSKPFLVLRDQVAAMQQTLDRMLEGRSFDAVHADQLWMAHYGMNAGAGLRVLDQHNAVFMVPRRMAEHERRPVVRTLLSKEADKLEAYERDVCRRFDHVVWVTEEDRRAVLSDRGLEGGRNSVIPIAADPAGQPPVKRIRPFRVTFLGGMHWPPNYEGVSWFVEKVWPEVASKAPGAVLTLIGKQPKSVRPHPPSVEYTGYLDRLEPLLSETSVFIVPIRSGAGMRVKILDAWCWGLPIVSTTVGAEGLRAVSGENLLIADDPEAFGEAVLKLLQDPASARRLADGGRATVEAHYDWKTAYRAWDDVYRRPATPVAQASR